MAELSLARRVNIALGLKILLGPYRWGKHDCCTVAAAIIEAVTGKRVDLANTPYSKYRGLSHAAAEEAAAADHGSVVACYTKGLLAAANNIGLPMSGLPVEADGRPGDILILGGALRVAAENRDPTALGTPMGYVGGDGEVYSWASFGLARCAEYSEISRWRFHEAN